MGAIVVTLIAVVIMLLFAIVVAVVRLAGVLRQLRTTVDSTRERIQPSITELNEAGQVTTVELAELQASVEELRAGREPGPSSSRR